MKKININTEIENLSNLRKEIVSYLQHKYLKGDELIKVIVLINEVKEIENQYNAYIEKYTDKIKYDFFNDNKSFKLFSNLFIFDVQQIFTLLNTTLNKNGFSSKNKISTSILSESELSDTIIDKYFESIEYKIRKYLVFRDNIQRDTKDIKW